MWDFGFNWYTLNVFTLAVEAVILFLALSALFIVLEEKRALKKREEQMAKKLKYGDKR